ncbi:TPA: two-component system sensor histidine kinase BaeA [Klebsiella pneumoniae]|nr:two-component system sensor histidine kinase BaeA [Klebsiella pneumoniae]
MKFWRPGITGKLFLAIFATCIVLLISMHWAVRISFERGFIDYIKRGNEQRLTMLSDALSEQYAQHGSWAFLRNNDRFIFQLLRTFERDNDDRSPPGHAMKPDAAPDGPPPDGPPDGPRPRPEMPPHGWRTMFWVVDQSGRVLVGPRERVPEDGTQRSIVVNGAEVGKVIASPVERLTRNTDINFDRQQKRTSWLIVALATLLAALATFPLARGLLAPVKRLVDDLHQLSMSDEGALAYQKTSLDIITLLEVAAGAFRERFASRQLSIQVSLTEQAMIFGDRDRLMQLFNNLLENSLRYTDSGGSLHITARRSGRMLVIDFADSAPGVSDEQLARLCERFYRAEGSRNRASGGSGLGLAICLNIVAAHGGTLRADHSPFGGVSIKVELPLEHDLPRDV